MSRPRIIIPEETQKLIWELREQKHTYGQIASRTGLKYNVVQRFLSQDRAGMVSVSDAGTKERAANIPTSTQYPPPTSQRQARYPNITADKDPRLTSATFSRRQPYRLPEPDSERTRHLRTQLEETRLSRQLWDEKTAERRAFDVYIKEITSGPKAPAFQPRPGSVLWEYSENTYKELQKRDTAIAVALLKDDIKMLEFILRFMEGYWRWRSFYPVYFTPLSPQQSAR